MTFEAMPLSSIFLAIVAVLLVLVAWALRRSRRTPPIHNRRTGPPRTAQPSVKPAPPIGPTITYADVKEKYDAAHARWAERERKSQKRIKLLQGHDFETRSPVDILLDASEEERRNLAVILGSPDLTSPTELVLKLRKTGSHSAVSLVRPEPVPYEEVVFDVAVKVGAPLPRPGVAAVEIEQAVVGAAFEQMLAKATPEQRAAIQADIDRSRAQIGGKAGIVAGSLVVAHLSGFGLYMAASSTLTAITSAVGVTLPFAVYTGMSSLIATITGPLGWAALATWAVARLGSPDYKKTVPAVLAIAGARFKLIAERDQELELLLADRDGPLAQEGRRLERLRRFLDGMLKPGATQTVPLSTVPW